MHKVNERLSESLTGFDSRAYAENFQRKKPWSHE